MEKVHSLLNTLGQYGLNDEQHQVLDELRRCLTQDAVAEMKMKIVNEQGAWSGGWPQRRGQETHALGTSTF